ncbi:hypothetical protein EVAR_50988_1 [Eumeta japonica]|uniref:Uncharacterized protein n=1 Tax=Eumeta variegata TaxID=151549 RepID=A0A4C1XDX4_EUMVA|nr:hypothetical protein EVAR_50988_1 [Eumeta japonica]
MKTFMEVSARASHRTVINIGAGRGGTAPRRAAHNTWTALSALKGCWDMKGTLNGISSPLARRPENEPHRGLRLRNLRKKKNGIDWNFQWNSPGRDMIETIYVPKKKNARKCCTVLMLSRKLDLSPKNKGFPSLGPSRCVVSLPSLIIRDTREHNCDTTLTSGTGSPGCYSTAGGVTPQTTPPIGTELRGEI